jgi:hypothetical protein
VPVAAVALDFTSAHATHAAVLVAVFVAVVLLLASVRIRLLREAGLASEYRASPYVVLALGSLLAAVVHAVVIPEHVDESGLYGAFFIVVTVAQVLYAVAVMVRPGRLLLVLGALGNAAIVVLWDVTRTAGIPLGPEAGEVEPVGLLDILAAVAEVAVVVAALAALRQAAMSSTAHGSLDSSSFDMQATSMASASATIDESR